MLLEREGRSRRSKTAVPLHQAGTLQGGVRLWAGLIGLGAGWFTRSIPITIIVGLGVYALLRWLGV